MDDLQRIGGVSALLQAVVLVVIILIFFIALAPTGYGTADVDPAQFVAFLADNQTTMFLWSLTSLALGGLTVVLALALYHRLQAGSPGLVQTATVFGLIAAALFLADGAARFTDLGNLVDLYGKDPAQAASVWVALDSAEEGLGNGGGRI